MADAPEHPSEKQRLELLNRLNILGSPAEPGLNALVDAASAVCDTPISLVSLVSSEHQWFKAAVGLEQGSGTPREHAFCAHSILEDALFEVADASKDPRFADNPLVTGDPNIRFYAGAQIRIDGLPLGTLCVIDNKPRTLDERQRSVLTSLAVSASTIIAAHARERAEEQLANVMEATDVGMWEYNVASGSITVNDRWAELIGYERGELEPLSFETFNELTHPADLNIVHAALDRHFAGETDNFECELRSRHKDGHWVWLYSRGRVLEWGEGRTPHRMFGVHIDIRQRKAQEASLQRMSELLASTGRLAKVGGWQLNLETQELLWTDETKRIHGVALDYEPDVETAISFYAPQAREQIRQAIEATAITGEGWDLELPFVRADQKSIWVHAQGGATFEGDEPKILYGAFQDITERRNLLQEVSESRELLRVTLESIGDAVITTDATGHITWMNPIAERLTGWSSEAADRQAIAEVFRAVNEQDRQPIDQPITRCLNEQRIVNLQADTVLISADGAEYGIEDSAAPIIDSEGQLLGAVMVFHDVTEQRRLTGEMRYRAKHDALTGLINRAEFESRLEQLLEEARETGSEHAVLYIDLDQFKIVNDSCGHAVGDELLQKVATVFKDVVRDRDTVARLGGDEFAVILERCPQVSALRLAQQVCDRVRELRFIHGERRFRVGTSIGLVEMSSNWSSISAIMQAADTACYAAKEAGRDRIHVYEASDSAILNQRSETRWATEIEAALENDRFVLFCQPIVPALEAERSSARPRLEVLLRMQQNNGLVLPGVFIPVAERFHLVARIDRWVISEALRVLADPQLSSTTLFVNISGRSLGDRLFQDFLLGAVRRHRAVSDRLVLEITETAMISNLVDVRDFLEELQRFGVGIALDDFGSGMASYGYLKSLPVDYLKLDGQFIKNVLDDALALATVRSFVEIASVLKIPTIAEHVEDEAVMRTLAKMEVDYVQGYHIKRPELAYWEETLTAKA